MIQKDLKEVVVSKIKPFAKIICHKCKTHQNVPIRKGLAVCRVCDHRDYFELESADPVDSFSALILKKLKHRDEVIISSPPHKSGEVNAIVRVLISAGIGLEADAGELQELKTEKKKCLQCAICNNCVQCICGKKYLREKGSCVCGKKLNEAIAFYFKKTIENASGINVCPNCFSERIRFTEFEDRRTCPKCRTKKFKELKIIHRYAVTLRKMRMFRKE